MGIITIHVLNKKQLIANINEVILWLPYDTPVLIFVHFSDFVYF